MLRIFLCLLLTPTFALTVCGAEVTANTPTGRSAGIMQLTEEERLCFDMINALRGRAGLSPFVLNADLIEQSRSWSANLQSRGYLYHGGAPEICAQTNTDGPGSGERAFQLWNNSPPHRAILYSNMTYVGIGNVGKYWTMRGESAVRERSSTTPSRERSHDFSFTGEFYYVPSGKKLSDILSEESKPKVQERSSDVPSTKRSFDSPSADGFYYVPSAKQSSRRGRVNR